MNSHVARSYRHCERLARREAGNFYHAFQILPRQQKQSMCALYAFMRITDDLGDGPRPIEQKRIALADWRTRFEGAMQGDYTHRIHPALHDAVNRNHIPVEYLQAVFTGVEMDLGAVHYATFPELYRYCYHVASVVGLACIHIWGFRDPAAKVYAEQAGVAFQLTNILRDLQEDAARGRLYLPEEDLQSFGCLPGQLLRGEMDEPFRALMEFEVRRARSYYEAALPLARLLSPAGRAVYQVMARTYAGLLTVMQERNYDVFSRRVRLSRWKKIGFVLQALPCRLGWSLERWPLAAH